jgi:hypothetical protein
MNKNQDNTGDDNVVIGNRKVNGSRNVIIDATDSNGSTILNRPMVIGYNAKGGPNDIVIGAGAGSGSELFLLLDKLASQSNSEVSKKIVTLVSELKSDQKDKSKIKTLWSSVEKVVTAGSAIDLVVKISPLIAALLT